MTISSFKYTKTEMLIKFPKIWTTVSEVTWSSHVEIQKWNISKEAKAIEKQWWYAEVHRKILWKKDSEIKQDSNSVQLQ